ncbi:arginase family protein [Streptomyces litchfieldiae]|uniref:Arginase family protein n=1 Tax=Streptomyces litchfieldiae TaxID=3075543 RepID=A0ABU2MKE4_9ACTN|nr:arginase family protein [Streptomyces sp. DSM 44938]MDT0342082.1 arginase family protein [Streptomyces sp. DSM 44938]
MTTVLCVPQWQGSASSKAPRLMAGARRAAELVPAQAVVTVPVLENGGEKAAGIRALDVLVENQRLTREALAGIEGRVITVGGDCAVDIAPIAAAHARYGDRLTVLWIDAHPDVYSPVTLPSGAFHGMVVRALLGDGPAGLTPDRPLAPEQVIIAGERAGDASEHEYLAKTGLRRYGVEDLERVLDGLRGPVYVHVDLDVLEPTVFGSTCYPEPDGVRPQRLIDLIDNVDEIVGAAITEHAPSGDAVNDAEAEVIRRLGAALAA